MACMECYNYNRFGYNQSYLIMVTNSIYAMEGDNLFVSQIYDLLESRTFSYNSSNKFYIISNRDPKHDSILKYSS
jgi:hypothetical protein